MNSERRNAQSKIELTTPSSIFSDFWTCLDEFVRYDHFQIDEFVRHSFGPLITIPGDFHNMARHASSHPTEVELQILRILWDDGPSIARHIHDSLQEFKQTTYSTTVKMLSVMLEKGLLRRDEETRPQVYRPALPRQRTQKRMLGDLIDKVYDGSAAALMLHALSSKKATPEELTEIRQLLDEMEGKS